MSGGNSSSKPPSGINGELPGRTTGRGPCAGWGAATRELGGGREPSSPPATRFPRSRRRTAASNVSKGLPKTAAPPQNHRRNRRRNRRTRKINGLRMTAAKAPEPPTRKSCGHRVTPSLARTIRVRVLPGRPYSTLVIRFRWNSDWIGPCRNRRPYSLRDRGAA